MIKVLSLFSGIGAFERACCRIGLDWELVNYCEIDRWASLSYSMVNQCSESLNLHDVRAVTAETVRDCHVDLITYGFPCQDISIAGKQHGFVNDSGESTRSGLFFEALRIIKELQPRYAIAENVKALTSRKFHNEFATVLSSLDNAGYNNYWSVLNAKDYGIPQNRERVFIVSIRKDVDKGDFQFPDKEPLMLRLRDMLEPAESVDEKYYLSTEREGVRRLIAELEARYKVPSADPVVAKIGGAPFLCQIGNVAKDPDREHIQDRIYDPSGLAPTLNTVGGGNLEPKIVIAAEPVIKKIADLNGHQSGEVHSPDGIAATVCACTHGYANANVAITTAHTYGVRIRKLTPRECWRLMGFLDEEFDRVHGISNSQLYKQAGNSIVVNVLSALLTQLFNKAERA